MDENNNLKAKFHYAI